LTTRARQSTTTIRLPQWLRWSIYAVTLWLFLTGVIWLGAHYGLRKQGKFGEVIHPLEPWMLRLHGMAVMIGLFLYGSLLRAHIIKSWQIRQNRATGAVIATILGLLTISGYLLYYAGDENIRPIISLAHWLIGLSVGAILPLHIWYGRNLQRSMVKNAH
jgi:hypothetical protein